MINVWDLNARVIIAFALTMIVLLLAYIAFFKESVEKTHLLSSKRFLTSLARSISFYINLANYQFWVRSALILVNF